MRTTLLERSASLDAQSELALGVNRRLAERGIGIPFPQRDLHLRSIAPEPRKPASSEGASGEPA